MSFPDRVRVEARKTNPANNGTGFFGLPDPTQRHLQPPRLIHRCPFQAPLDLPAATAPAIVRVKCTPFTSPAFTQYPCPESGNPFCRLSTSRRGGRLRKGAEDSQAVSPTRCRTCDKVLYS